MIEKAVSRALEGREAIRNADDDVLITAQAARYARVVDASEPARIVGDAVIAAHFSADKSKARGSRSVRRSKAGLHRSLWNGICCARRATRARVEKGWRPFHWEIEFPEVFARDNPGFDAVVGNPPFAGKNTITAASGPHYLPWLQTLHEGAHGNADLVAHFFRRAFGLAARRWRLRSDCDEYDWARRHARNRPSNDCWQRRCDRARDAAAINGLVKPRW